MVKFDDLRRRTDELEARCGTFAFRETLFAFRRTGTLPNNPDAVFACLTWARGIASCAVADGLISDDEGQRQLDVIDACTSTDATERDSARAAFQAMVVAREARLVAGQPWVQGCFGTE